MKFLMQAMGLARNFKLSLKTEAWGDSSLKHAFYLLIVRACPPEVEDEGWLVAQIIDLRDFNKHFNPVDSHWPIRRRLQVAEEMHAQLWRLVPSLPEHELI